jgi:DNA gyrase subunit A
VGDDTVVGMVVADPDATLLTACANGYGKRTPFGPNMESGPEDELPEQGEHDEDAPEVDNEPEEHEAAEEGDEHEESSQRSYRTQRRGGKGLRDIKTTERNGPVVSIVHVSDVDELLMMTARGKIQRIAASDISIIGRNTQGVKIMSLDDDDALIAVKRVPQDEENGKAEEE